MRLLKWESRTCWCLCDGGGLGGLKKEESFGVEIGRDGVEGGLITSWLRRAVCDLSYNIGPGGREAWGWGSRHLGADVSIFTTIS